MTQYISTRDGIFSPSPITASVYSSLLVGVFSLLFVQSGTQAREYRRTQEEHKMVRQRGSRTQGGASDAAGELRKLRGQWETVSMEIDGKKVTDKELFSAIAVEFIFTDTKLTLVSKTSEGKTREDVCPYHIDPKSKPKTIDITAEHRGERVRFRGLYAIDGDRLTLCLPAPDAARPVKLESTPGSKVTVVKCKRAKP